MIIFLYKDPSAGKAFAEFFRCTAFLLPEDAVEVAHIVEAAAVGDLRNGMRGIDQHARCMSQSNFRKAVYKCIAGALFEEAAETHFRHIRQPGHIRQCDHILKMLVHVFESAFNATAVVCIFFRVVESGVGEKALIAADAEIVQDAHQLQYRIETMLLVQLHDAWRELLRGVPAEKDAAYRFFEHRSDKAQLIAAEEFFIEEIAVELDGHFFYGLTGTLMRKPGMLQVGPYQHQFNIFYLFHMITDHTLRFPGMADKIQLEFFMAMQRKIETGFHAGKKREAIVLRQWCDLT